VEWLKYNFRFKIRNSPNHFVAETGWFTQTVYDSLTFEIPKKLFPESYARDSNQTALLSL